VIVNAGSAVDKQGFVYSVNGLREFQYVGKGVYERRSEVGQESASLQTRGFCTSDPVDMQRVFHSRAVFHWFDRAGLVVLAARQRLQNLDQGAVTAAEPAVHLLVDRTWCSRFVFCRQNDACGVAARPPVRGGAFFLPTLFFCLQDVGVLL
jgi:hypothetical protein